MFSQKLIDEILVIAKQAGEVLLKYYAMQNFSVTDKDDKSPVTIADIEANKLIISGLQKLLPQVAIISEENSAQENLQAAKANQYFLIDPLDGTEGFIKKSDQFTVNIAFVEKAVVVFGVIYVPAKDVIYFTAQDGSAYKIEKGYRQKIKVTKNDKSITVIATKREPEKSEVINHLHAKNLDVKEFISISSSYKFCLIAEGSADLYVRKASIKAWDIAAGHAIVKAAGGNVRSFDGDEISYNFTNQIEDRMVNFSVPFFEVY